LNAKGDKSYFCSPGFMKSDKPKSVAFKGESSLVDLKRKFCVQGGKNLIDIVAHTTPYYLAMSET